MVSLKLTKLAIDKLTKIKTSKAKRSAETKVHRFSLAGDRKQESECVNKERWSMLSVSLSVCLSLSLSLSLSHFLSRSLSLSPFLYFFLALYLSVSLSLSLSIPSSVFISAENEVTPLFHGSVCQKLNWKSCTQLVTVSLHTVPRIYQYHRWQNLLGSSRCFLLYFQCAVPMSIFHSALQFAPRVAKTWTLRPDHAQPSVSRLAFVTKATFSTAKTKHVSWNKNAQVGLKDMLIQKMVFAIYDIVLFTLVVVC